MNRYYNMLIAILALIFILLVVLDYSGLITLSNYLYRLIDNNILVIFMIDYLVWLFKAPQKFTFIR